MNKRVVMITAAVMAVAVPASANWAVYDYANLMEAKRLFDQAKAQVEHFKQQATYLFGKRRFATPYMTTWKWLGTPQSSSRTKKWLGAANAGLDAIDAWEAGVYKTINYGDLSAIPETMRDRRERELDAIEAQDGTGVSALEAIGEVRASSKDVTDVMRALEIATASEEQGENTEAAQLNLANLYAAQQVKAQTANNRLAMVAAEMALQRLRQERDASVQALTTEVRFHREALEAAKLVFGGESEAMLRGVTRFR